MQSKTIIISILIAILIVAAAFSLAYNSVRPDHNQFQQAKEINFQELKKGYYNSILKKQGIVIQSTPDWADLWAKMFPNQMIASAIDFNNNTIIAIFQGEKNTGGYSIEVWKIIDRGEYVEVIVKETSPAPGSIATQAITSPYQIVIAEKITKEVRFTFI